VGNEEKGPGTIGFSLGMNFDGGSILKSAFYPSDRMRTFRLRTQKDQISNLFFFVFYVFRFLITSFNDDSVGKSVEKS